MKRRWKVIWAFNFVFVMLGILAYFEPNLRWPFAFWFLGYINGLVIYSGGMDAEERENAEWAFQDKVYESLMWHRTTKDNSEDEAVNKTAVEHDLSPSRVRSIAKLYEEQS